MTFAEVQELFVRAAFLFRKDLRGEQNRELSGSGPWPRYFYEQADIAGWSAKDRKAFELRLARNGGDYGDARRSREAVDLRQKATELMGLVRDESERRCLWAWAMAKAKGMPFAVWCASEKIHVETGTRRKNRAIGEIVARNKSNAPLDSGFDDYAVLPEEPENWHKTPTLAADATTRIRAERDHQTQAARDTILADYQLSRTWWRRKVTAARAAKQES